MNKLIRFGAKEAILKYFIMCTGEIFCAFTDGPQTPEAHVISQAITTFACRHTWNPRKMLQKQFVISKMILELLISFQLVALTKVVGKGQVQDLQQLY